ncbi:hypothetical protein AFL94_08750 [Arthrobacter sp. LS16]|nr:hypothetical protein AFL94_08750 [Arthrobacter sp. LS16]
MVAAFSFGPLGAMTDLVVAPAVAPQNERGFNEFVSSGGVRHVQSGRRNPRRWVVERPWQDPEFARMLSLAAAGAIPEVFLYDRATARVNMIPDSLSLGPVRRRVNLVPDPSFESGTGQGGVSSASAGGSSTITWATDWADTWTHSLKITPGDGSSSAYPWWQSGALARMGIARGKTYTLGATIRLAAAQTGALNSAARRIAVGVTADGATNFGYALSDAAPNEPGVTRLKVTFSVPSNAQNLFVRLMNGSSTVPVWWDSLTLEEGETDGTYFDATTPTWAGSDALFQVPEAGPVTWQATQVPVIAGRLYTVYAWSKDPGPPLQVRANETTQNLPNPIGGLSTYSFQANADQFVQLTTLGASPYAVRMLEGIGDGKYYSGAGTPCRVAVRDPQLTYQMVTNGRTVHDVQVELVEVGRTGAYT